MGEYTVKDLRHYPAGDGKSFSFVFFQLKCFSSINKQSYGLDPVFL